ncbi:IclR family transcriptional regulator [Pseudonocardia humida]|uniref:IclR family transcriptional regulator n=1 Tax=Pseudonocardia humida TaxID=2800819 RepID=A0ABT0ZSE2_9PSEU|nr:IclR family transcriptional regulator [Pseudonocardia humida]MCO1653633.1 IclR family transcriptional regulator [Pseudonocardia humida]
MQNRPAYAIDSVDHALRLATLLRQEGPLGVSEAALRLGVARSTAHRLLAMLVYRDFAARDARRRYVAGPALGRPVPTEPVAELRSLALPHLRALTERVDETSNLTVLVGDQVRFVVTVEAARVLRVGDREGRALPAHLASGGKALLASRTDEEVLALYAGPHPTVPPVVDTAALLRELRRVRRRGFALNDRGTEAGVTAIGRAVRGPRGAASIAVSLAMPTSRFRRDRLAGWAGELAETATRIERELATTG